MPVFAPSPAWRAHLFVVLHLDVIELFFELPDDFRDLVANRRRINFDAVINRREFSQKCFCDFAVRRNDDFAGLGIHHVERNFFAEQNVAQRLGQLVGQFADFLLMVVLDLFRMTFFLARSGFGVRSPSFLDETFTSMTMP